MGGLCSRDEAAPFDDVNHSRPNCANNVASLGQPQNDVKVQNSEILALKDQLDQLEERNQTLQRAAKDAARSYAELQAKQDDLQSQQNGLRSAKEEAERKLAEAQKQCLELKSINNQLRRRVSDLAMGESVGHGVEAPPREELSEAEERSRGILASIRDCNPGSKISVAFWRSSDFKHWHGVRFSNGDVTGLALSNMQLAVLPSEIGQLTGLTTLMLSNNGLIQLPAAIGKLTLLTSLLLDGNNLKQLPPELCDLTQLQTLWLHDNQLASLPHALGKLANLRQLIANDNMLESLPQSSGELRSLTSLWLDNNRITELPETFSQLTNLKRLRVDPPLARLLPDHLRTRAGSGAAQQPASPRPGTATAAAQEEQEEEGAGLDPPAAAEGVSQQQEGSETGAGPQQAGYDADERAALRQQRAADASASCSSDGTSEGARGTLVDGPEALSDRSSAALVSPGRCEEGGAEGCEGSPRGPGQVSPQAAAAGALT